MTAPQDTRAAQRRLVSAATDARAPFIATGVAALAGSIAIVGQMIVAGQLIASAFEPSAQAGRGRLAAWLCFFIAARALATAAGEWAGQRLATITKSAIRLRAIRAVVDRGPRADLADHTGELVTSVMDGVEKLDAFYRRFLPQAIATAIVPVVVLTAALVLDPLTGAILAVTGPLIPLFMWLLGVMAEHRSRQQWRALGLLGSRFLDTLQGLPTLMLFNRQHGAAAALDDASELLRLRTMGVLRIAFLSGLVLELAASVSTAIVAATVGVRLIEGSLAFVPGLTVLLLAPEFYLPFRQLGQRHHAGLEGIAAAERIFALMDRVPDVKTVRGSSDREANDDGLRLTDISVRYPGTDRDALMNVSLTLTPRSLTAIVGPSGAGKSTLLGVILGFVPSTSGDVTIGGRSIGDASAPTWRRNLSYVPQRPRFIYASIADNLRIGNPRATLDEVVGAARLAEIDTFISSLPSGYATLIDDTASTLSGGERQRLAIARAALKPSAVLILDEPTSSLDSESERLIARALERISAHRTVLVAAHRLSTVSNADQIVVLERGAVVEVGTPGNLLSSDRAYARLVRADRQEVA